ncbi:MAG TPA: hypothetical protein DHU55_16560 [Blastocatellia bacterium]|jgi:hypothetical protein|nr:hypothetical protein [Blastocatellia bacterium]HAF23490.1 hypothetical protein [Blastocatellia bacterium]HCX31360.1 hypothetical protein [Blastocatellia bacterium]
MRILIDECLDWRLCRSITGHDCASVQMMGWGGLANGALLKRAEQEFEVFLTGDRNLTFQQEIRQFNIAIVVLHAVSTQLRDTQPLMPKMLALLPTIQSGEVVGIYP